MKLPVFNPRTMLEQVIHKILNNITKLLSKSLKAPQNLMENVNKYMQKHEENSILTLKIKIKPRNIYIYSQIAKVHIM